MGDQAHEPSPQDSAALAPTLADLVAGLGCRAGAIMSLGEDGVAFRASHGLTEEAIDSYLDYWHRRDPWLGALRAGPRSGRVERSVRGEDLVGLRLLRGSEFHRGWLAPNGLGSASFAAIGGALGRGDMLCVWRPLDGPTLSRAELHLLRAVAAAICLALRQPEQEPGAAAAAEFVARSAVPIVLLGGDCAILWANAAASGLWSGEAPFRRVGARLGLRSQTHAPRFSQAVADQAQQAARGAILGIQTDTGIVSIRLQPMLLGSGRTVVALAACLSETHVPSAGTIAAALGLTRAQAEVAALLCRGMETAAISAVIGISQHTLNGHLRELYDRLRAANRVQAVARVLGAASALTLLSPSAGNGANGGHGNGSVTNGHTPK